MRRCTGRISDTISMSSARPSSPSSRPTRLEPRRTHRHRGGAAGDSYVIEGLTSGHDWRLFQELRAQADCMVTHGGCSLAARKFQDILQVGLTEPALDIGRLAQRARPTHQPAHRDREPDAGLPQSALVGAARAAGAHHHGQWRSVRPRGVSYRLHRRPESSARQTAGPRAPRRGKAPCSTDESQRLWTLTPSRRTGRWPASVFSSKATARETSEDSSRVAATEGRRTGIVTSHFVASRTVVPCRSSELTQVR
jgi:hypothetical protein